MIANIIMGYKTNNNIFFHLVPNMGLTSGKIK